jgi:hypothetical protein
MLTGRDEDYTTKDNVDPVGMRTTPPRTMLTGRDEDYTTKDNVDRSG